MEGLAYRMSFGKGAALRCFLSFTEDLNHGCNNVLRDESSRERNGG